MAARQLSRICREAREQFNEVGAVVLRGVFDKPLLRQVATGIARNQSAPSRFSYKSQDEEGPGSHFADYCNWYKIPQFKDFVHNSSAGEIAGRIMKSQYAVFYHDFVIVKEAGDQEIAPWHCNQSYYPIDGMQNCCIWLPLDPVSKPNSLQFVSGSHRWKEWFFPRRLNPDDYPKDPKWVKDREFLPLPDVDKAVEEGKMEVVSFDVEPGDCVIYHMKTLYMSPANNEKRTRRVLSTRWLGEDAVLARRPWQVSPPILGGLRPGMTIKTEVFPLIWNKSPKEYSSLEGP